MLDESIQARESDVQRARATRPAPCREPRAGARRRLTALFLAVFALGGCVTPYDPYKIPREELHARIDTIALAPFAIGVNVGDREALTPVIERLVGDRLRAGGWTVLPMEVMAGAWGRTAEAVGPIYDAKTGRVDDERWELALDLVFRELSSEHGADAVLFASIRPVEVETGATFCGTAGGRPWGDDDLGSSTPVLISEAGCLYVNVVDLENRQIYGIRWGLEIYRTLAKQTRWEIPHADRFTDERLLADAVEATVGPLADRP